MRSELTQGVSKGNSADTDGVEDGFKRRGDFGAMASAAGVKTPQTGTPAASKAVSDSRENCPGAPQYNTESEKVWISCTEYESSFGHAPARFRSGNSIEKVAIGLLNLVFLQRPDTDCFHP
jgi:hypothetical protein